MKKLYTVLLCLFCSIGLSVKSRLYTKPHDTAYERIRKKAMKMWSTLDILRAIHLSENDKVTFCKLLSRDALLLHSYLDRFTHRVEFYEQHPEDIMHLVMLCDYIEDVFTHAFCSSVCKYSTCFTVVMELFKDRLEWLVAPGDVEACMDSCQGCLEYMFPRESVINTES